MNSDKLTTNEMLGILFILASIFLFKTSTIGGMLAVLATALLYLPLNSYLPKKFRGVYLSDKLICACASILLLVAILVTDKIGEMKIEDKISATKEKFYENKSNILRDINIKINENKYIEAEAIASEFLRVNDADLNLLNTKLKSLKTKAELAKKEVDLINEINNTPINDFTVRDIQSKLKKLIEISPSNKQYQDSLSKIEPEVLKLEEKENRVSNIARQFSVWDGSNYVLTKAIKAGMHDPSSYEHVRTSYVEKPNWLIVKTVFRGKNSFGALILSEVEATISIDGRLLSIKEGK